MATRRRARRTIHALAALIAAFACGAGACSSQPPPTRAAGQHGATRAGEGPARAAPDAGAPGAGGIRLGRTPLGAAETGPLPFSIERTLDGGSVVFVSDSAAERVGWVRRLDGATGERGPALRLEDEDLAGAFASEGGGTTLITARDGQICAVSFRRGEDLAASRACAPARPSAMALVGDRVALLEVETVRSAEGKTKAKAGAAKSPRARAGAARAAKADAKNKGDAKKKPSGAGAKRDKKRAGKKPGKKQGGAQGRAAKPVPVPEVEVLLRWLSAASGPEASASPTGLRFRPPLEGMALIDAAGRPGAIDLLHYGEAPKRRGAPALGSGRIVGVTLGEDGRFDPARRAVVAEGDLEYGTLRGHQDPRLYGTKAGAVYVGLEGRGGPCVAVRLAPSVQPLLGGGGGALAAAGARAACAVDPARLADPAPLAQGEIAALERILAGDGRRAAGQPRHDPGLAGWAGERAYWQVSGELFSAPRQDGAPRGEATPFPARRSRVAWGAFSPDGEGIALAAGQLHRMDARGAVAGAGSPLPGRLGTPAGEPERAADRRRVARIGASWWIARTDVARLLPEPLVVPDLRGRAHPDASALAGGRDRGLFLEVAGGALRVTAIAPSGALAPVTRVASPVRPGLDACERGAGGAIVAGVSASDPRKAVAFAIDGEGRVGPARPTSLPVLEGDFGVRLVALPDGGALLADLARRHVVWLDDEGAERASLPWPAEDSGAACLDGRPARREIPAPAPGVFARVAELGAPGACLVGDPAWAPDGTLRWFGSTAAGLETQAEAGIARPAAPAPAEPAARPPGPAPAPSSTLGAPGRLTAPAAPNPSSTLGAPGRLTAPSAPNPSSTFGAPGRLTAPSAPNPSSTFGAPGRLTAPSAPNPSCPADMVAIDGGRFCVDRFEATLVDAASGETLAPDWPPTPNLLEFVLADWATGRQRAGDVPARAFPLPPLPAWQRGRKIDLVARARLGARPSGYVTGLVAESACKAAGKRLCTPDEFVVACRGEDDTLHPYGDAFEDGACNVNRDAHPAAILHGNASIGHLDPRLNRVRANGEPLFRESGATPRCRSRWGGDAVYDMVGNLDEWVDDPDGAFAGGFYSRSTRAGCDALVTAHPRTYADYSTGIRCCRDGEPLQQQQQSK